MKLLDALKKPFDSIRMSLSRSSYEDQVVAFLAATLKESNACLLLSDPRQEKMYEAVLRRLKSVDGHMSHSLFDMFPETPWSEVVIIHSGFDPNLLQEVANGEHVQRIVYIAEFGDLGSGKYMDTVIDKRDLRSPSVDVVFAFYTKCSSYTQPPISREELHAMHCRIGATRQ